MGPRQHTPQTAALAAPMAAAASPPPITIAFAAGGAGAASARSRSDSAGYSGPASDAKRPLVAEALRKGTTFSDATMTEAVEPFLDAHLGRFYQAFVRARRRACAPRGYTLTMDIKAHGCTPRN